jgi:hypothetical protein
MSRRVVRSARSGLGALAVVLLLAVAPAAAQVPQPIVPDVTQRSGLITRQSRIMPVLPPDPDRDKFYDTYWGDHPKRHRNWFREGGLYGQLLPGGCAQCYYPNYHGSPGSGPAGPICEPCPKWTRLVSNFAHPFRPVCYYYAGGCYAPVYDLDPLVTGPGPFPWNVFKRRWNGG